MSIPANDLPADFAYGKVMGRIILAVGDTADEGTLPDAVPATGKVDIMPKAVMLKAQIPEPVTVIAQKIPCALDSEGYLLDPAGNRGVWLIAGIYTITYTIASVTIPTHDIQVTTSHTELDPLWLTNATPPGGATVSTTEYAELSSRIDSLAEVTIGPEPALEIRYPNMLWVPL